MFRWDRHSMTSQWPKSNAERKFWAEYVIWEGQIGCGVSWMFLISCLSHCNIIPPLWVCKRLPYFFWWVGYYRSHGMSLLWWNYIETVVPFMMSVFLIHSFWEMSRFLSCVYLLVCQVCLFLFIYYLSSIKLSSSCLASIYVYILLSYKMPLHIHPYVTLSY